MRLEGKRALVTGSSQGIGAAIAKLFASEGATVVVNHRGRANHTDSVLGAIKQAGGKGFTLHADVSDPASVKGMFRDIKKRIGGLDVLVNTAGLADPGLWNQDLGGSTLDMWNRVFSVDAFGTFLCSQGAVAMMGKGSAIVNVASIPALVGDADGLIYASAKGAVISMTKMLARMLAPGTRVNCMALGSIATTWVDWLTDEQKKAYRSAIPLGRFGDPDEAAKLALFLASDESSFITGQVVVLDGGETMR